MRRAIFLATLALLVLGAGIGSAGVIEVEGGISVYIVPPPTATINGGPLGGPYNPGPFSGPEPGTLEFLACCAVDPSGGTLTFAWDLDYNGVTFTQDATGAGPVSHTYPDGPATHLVALLLTSTSGATNLITQTITVLNVPPTASVGGPYSGTMGTPVTFAGSASDPSPADTSAGLLYEWDFDFTGAFSADASGINLTAPTFTYATAGNFTVALRVTDKDGGASCTCTAPVTITGSLTATAIGDSHIRENSTGTNFGATTPMFVRSDGGSDRRSLVSFNVSSIPANATITAATLRLNASAVPSSSRTHQVFRVTEAWTETGVTWANQPTIAATPTSAVATPAAVGTVTWDVASDVQAWVNGTAVNNGLLVRDLTESSGTLFEAAYDTREVATPSLRPTLTVTYTVP